MKRESKQVREMFASIAHRYDLLNHLLSLSIDRYWRKTAARSLSGTIRDGAVVLDLCTGTADLALELARKHTRVVGCDFCHPMLVFGIQKVKSLGAPEAIHLVEGDVLNLPFPSASFDGVSIAFGLRNLESYSEGLAEMFRVLRPGGTLAILEFSQPRLPLVRQLYFFYFTRVLPWIGARLSGAHSPYAYLPESVRQFPDPKGLVDLLNRAGFVGAGYRRMTAGIASLHVAHKPETEVRR